MKEIEIWTEFNQKKHFPPLISRLFFQKNPYFKSFIYAIGKKMSNKELIVGV